MNRFAIIAVLAILAYIVYTNIQRVRAIRQEARGKERSDQANWDTFQSALDQVRARKGPFVARSANLPEDERTHLWQPVQNNIVMACNAYLSRNFPRAMAYLLEAQTKADALVAG